jgi:hypothetical protein
MKAFIEARGSLFLFIFCSELLCELIDVKCNLRVKIEVNRFQRSSIHEFFEDFK